MSQSPRYADLLGGIAEEQRRFGSSPQPPCTAKAIERLIAQAHALLRADLPAEYLEFLRLANGLDWNGVVVYASDTVPIVAHPDRSIAGVVEMNLAFRDVPAFQELLVLGSDGMDLYTYNLATRVYEQYDEVPHEVIETFTTFDALMTRLLTRVT